MFKSKGAACAGAIEANLPRNLGNVLGALITCAAPIGDTVTAMTIPFSAKMEIKPSDPKEANANR
jgi:hypothetical protein